MAEHRFRNQRRIIDGDILGRTRFVIVGAGAIGTAFTVALCKMGARLVTVYDFDTIEDHNFANQMHPVSQLGKPKVDSLSLACLDYGDCKINTINAPWTPGNAVDADVVVSCVDNMDVRRALWDYYKGRNVFFVDGRMSAFVYKVFGIDARDLPEVHEIGRKQSAHYELSLHSQAEAAPEPCGEKSIIYTVYSVASMMLDQIKKYICGEYRPTEIIGDMYNLKIRTVYHMEQKLETLCAEDTEEE